MIKWVLFCKDSNAFYHSEDGYKLENSLNGVFLFDSRDKARESKSMCDVVKKVKVTVELV